MMNSSNSEKGSRAACSPGLERTIDRAASPIGVPPGSTVLTTESPESERRLTNRRACVDFPDVSMPSNAISFPLRSIAFTPKQNGQDDEDSAHGDTGIGHIKDRESADLEEIEHVAPHDSIHQVAQCTRQNERHARANQLAVDVHGQQNQKQDERDDSGHDKEDNAATGKDPEGTAVVMNACETNDIADQVIGHSAIEIGGNPPFGHSIDDEEEQR